MSNDTGFNRFFFLPIVAAVSFAAVSSQAQNSSDSRSSSNVYNSSTPDTKPTQAWHDTLPDKLINAKVREGVLTVDGLLAKVHLNYEVHEAAYMYVFLPGTGTAIVSLSPMANAQKVKDLFHGSKMAFDIEGHSVELESQGSLVGEGASTGYVILDHSTPVIARTPMFGFGMTTRPPYVWPLSGKPSTTGENAFAKVPRNMLPRTEADPR